MCMFPLTRPFCLIGVIWRQKKNSTSAKKWTIELSSSYWDVPIRFDYPFIVIYVEGRAYADVDAAFPGIPLPNASSSSFAIMRSSVSLSTGMLHDASGSSLSKLPIATE